MSSMCKCKGARGGMGLTEWSSAHYQGRDSDVLTILDRTGPRESGEKVGEEPRVCSLRMKQLGMVMHEPCMS